MGLKADLIKTSPVNGGSLSTMALREGIEAIKVEMEGKAILTTVDGEQQVIDGPAILLINKD